VTRDRRIDYLTTVLEALKREALKAKKGMTAEELRCEEVTYARFGQPGKLPLNPSQVDFLAVTDPADRRQHDLRTKLDVTRRKSGISGTDWLPTCRRLFGSFLSVLPAS
jgi:hypothetical protein